MLQPKLLGDSVGVHPLMMLLALWTGLVTAGLLGFIVGPVLVIIAKAAYDAGLFRFSRDENDAAQEETGIGGRTGATDEAAAAGGKSDGRAVAVPGPPRPGATGAVSKETSTAKAASQDLPPAKGARSAPPRNRATEVPPTETEA